MLQIDWNSRDHLVYTSAEVDNTATKSDSNQALIGNKLPTNITSTGHNSTSSNTTFETIGSK